MNKLTSPSRSYFPLSPIINRILTSGKITRADESCFLKAATSDQPLSEEDSQQIRRIFERLEMGLLRIVD